MNELNKTLNQNIEEMMGLTRSVAKQQAAAFRRKDALSTQIKLAQVVTNPELLPEDNEELVMLMMNFNPMSVPVTKKNQENLVTLSKVLKSRIDAQKTNVATAFSSLTDLEKETPSKENNVKAKELYSQLNGSN